MESLAIGRQLVIVDVQPKYKDHIPESLPSEILNYAKGFASIVYIWDGGPDSMLDGEKVDIFKAFKDSHLRPRFIGLERSYGFLRAWMDSKISEEDILDVQRDL